MTRKDFNLLARSIREQREIHLAMYEPIGDAAMAEYAQHLARDLGDHHPRFDRARFLAACEPIPENYGRRWLEHRSTRTGDDGSNIVGSCDCDDCGLVSNQ